MSNPFSGAIASMTTVNRRASRAEFFVGAFVGTTVTVIIGAPAIGMAAAASESTGNFVGFLVLAAYWLGMVVLTKNRFNDFGASGWWQLIPFAPFVALFIAGDEGPNAYGARK